MAVFGVATVGQTLGVGAGSTEGRTVGQTVVLSPGVQSKENKKTDRLIQSEQRTGQPRCDASTKRVSGQDWGIRGFCQEWTWSGENKEGSGENSGPATACPLGTWPVPEEEVPSANRCCALLGPVLVISASGHTSWPCSTWPVFMAQSLVKG